MQDPFSTNPPSNLHVSLLAIMEDISTPLSEAPTPLELPLDVIKINAVMALTQLQFKERSVNKDDTSTGFP